MTQSIVSKNTVVYADDDADDIELVEDAFRQFAANVEVVPFTDGSQALHYLEGLGTGEALPCLIILDINMPVLNGKDTLQRLRENNRFENIPVVLFTTSSMPVDRRFAEQYKAGFVTKPLGYEQMEFITKEFINHCSEDIQEKIRRLRQ